MGSYPAMFLGLIFFISLFLSRHFSLHQYNSVLPQVTQLDSTNGVKIKTWMCRQRQELALNIRPLYHFYIDWDYLENVMLVASPIAASLDSLDYNLPW